MNKKQLHHFWIRFRALKPTYFLVVAVLSSLICIFALRANNEHMLQLKQALYQADQTNGDVHKALYNLQSYVTAHMNTNLTTGTSSVYPPIQLAGTYDRLVQAQSTELQKQNSQIYTEAQASCEQQNHTDISGRNRVPCIEQYVTSHGVKPAAVIPDSLYKFNFISPRWSPDLAGWSMIIASASALLTASLFLVQRWFKTTVS